MNLSHLYYFRMLARKHSFKDAAAELYISEPTLSIAIKKLETELGTELVIRKRSAIELTPEGEEFAECVEQSLHNLDEHVASIKTHARERNRTLRLGIVFSLQQRVWLPLVNDFWIAQNREPDNIIKQGTTEQLLRALKNGKIDVIIAGTLGKDDSVVSYPMWTSPALAAINTENPLSSHASVTFDDIRDSRLLTYVSDGPLGEECRNLAKQFDLNPLYAYANEPSICSNVASQPDSIGIVCDSWLAYSFENVAIIPIEDSPKDFHRFWLTHRANPPKSHTLLREFVDFAKDYDYNRYL
jgi:LysR family transcriptional activator of glutamate synthase operon